MNPWMEVLNQIWYYLEQGPKSSGVTSEFPAGNRYRYGSDGREAEVPENVTDSVLIVDQTGGELDMDYSSQYMLAREEYQITVWSDTLELAKVNDLRLKVLSAIASGLPDFGIDSVLDIKLRTGRVTLTLDKIERDADGRLMQWRRDIRKSRKRAILLELIVTFLIDRDEL